MGSNLGDRSENIRQALERLQAAGDVTVVCRSQLYETAPVDYLAQPDFLNSVVEVKTSLSAIELLARTQAVEKSFSRERTLVGGPRLLDIDILAYDNQICDTPELKLPHPRMCRRKFVLIPLLEIAPDAYCHKDARPFVDCLRMIADQSQGIRFYHG